MGLASLRRHRGGYETRPVHASPELVEHLPHHELLERFRAEKQRADQLDAKLTNAQASASPEPEDSRFFPGAGVRAGSVEEWELLSIERDELDGDRAETAAAHTAALAALQTKHDALETERDQLKKQLAEQATAIESLTAPPTADKPADPPTDVASEPTSADTSAKAEETKSTGSKGRSQKGSS